MLNKVKFELSQSQDYRVVHINGVFGGLSPDEGRMILYVDRLVPEILDEPAGAMKLQKINRELVIDIRMSPAQFKSIAEWMLSHIKELEDATKMGIDKSDTPRGMYG